MVDYYLGCPLLLDVYSYMSWDELRRQADVPNLLWERMCDYFCIDSKFQEAFDRYGGRSTIERRTVFLHYINVALNIGHVTSILFQDTDFMLYYLKHNRRYSVILNPRWYDDEEIILKFIKRRGAGILNQVNEKLRSNRNFMLCALKYSGYALRYASNELRNDKDLVRIAIQKVGTALEHTSNELKADREIVSEAMKNDPRALLFANNIFRDDESLLLEAFRIAALNPNKMEQNNVAYIFDHMSARIKTNRNIVLDMVKYCGKILRHTNFIDDKEIVMAAVSQNGAVLEYVSESLKGDIDVVTAAVKQYGYALRYASEEMRANTSVVFAAVSQYGDALEYAYPDCQGNKKISLAAVMQSATAYMYTSLNSDSDILLRAIRPHLTIYQSESANKKIAEKFIRWGYHNFKPKDYLLEIDKPDGHLLRYASLTLRANKDLMMKIVNRDGYALNFLDPNLKLDKDIVSAAISNCGKTITYADPMFQLDPAMILLGLKNNSDISCIHPSLRMNKEIMEMASKYDRRGCCDSLFYADPKLKEDDDFVMKCINDNIKNYQHIIPVF